MDAATARSALSTLAAIAPLAEIYAYAPELGLELRRRFPLAWGEFKEMDPRWRPRQADGLAFVAHLESIPGLDWPGAAAAMIAGHPVWAAELANTVAYETGTARQGDARPASGSLGAPGLPLYAPAECAAYASESAPEIAWALEALSGASRCESHPAEVAQIALAHPRPFIEAIERFAAQGGGALDPETHLVPGALAAMRAAAGAMIRAVHDGIAVGPEVLACAIRPGSHHAGIARPMGTCVFNNLAIGASFALTRGLERVAIVDVDAHHGNGTREIFATDERVLTVSIHESPLYPGTCGQLADARANLDLPLAAGSGSAACRRAWDQAVEAIEAHRPQLILVEASFDAHAGDVVSGLGWQTTDFASVFAGLGALARSHSAPLVLEIGAGLVRSVFQEALAASVAAARAACSA